MVSLSPYLFIHIGLDIRLLRHAQDFTVEVILTEAQTLIRNLESANFPVSVAGSFNLKQFVSTLESDADKKRKITSFETASLSSIMHLLENIVYAEAQTKIVYVVGETRFSLESLMEHPDRMFASGVFEKLSPISKFDLFEGFNCLVFSRATAGAFHILRGTESILRSYYQTKIKRGREQQPMWANMVNALNAKRNKNGNLLQKLDFIRVNYRNPTAHPDAVYSTENLQDLIGLCIDVINAMAEELPQRIT